jgi:hypothetical protein
VVDRFGGLARVGVQHVILSIADVWDARNIDTFGRDIIPQVHAMEPRAI